MTISIPTLDPLKIVNECIVLVVMIVTLFFLYRYRDRVLLALTGDTHIHANTLDFLWASLRCCGTCNGEWTRHFITCCPCFHLCGLQGANLVREAGRLIGFASHDVELRNITVGDLPFDRPGDFYLTVECASNPDQVTSIAISQSPKIIHFAEVLTLRMRASWLESKVRFKVRELNVFGSTDLCELSLSAQSVLDWRKDPGHQGDKLKRFEMRVLVDDYEPETSPWIVMELDFALNAPMLETAMDKKTVSTTVYDNQGTATQEALPLLDIKERYTLVDNTGSAVQEPYEGDLQHIHLLRTWLVRMFHLLNFVTTVVIVGFCGARFYMWSCYTQYKHLAMAQMSGASFPISLYKLNELVDSCNDQIKGTGVEEGIPCRPSDEQIEQVCRNPPAGQPAVGAGKMLAHKLFDWDVDGIVCYSPTDTAEWDICQWRNLIRPWDVEIFIGLFLLMLMTICMRTMGNGMIRQYKNRLQKNHAEKLFEAKKGIEKTDSRSRK